MKKKNNNKGFAVTALLYGLSIMSLMTVTLMMSIAQNSRKNTTSTVKAIEEGLNSYGETSTVISSAEQSYTVPRGQAGYYRIEVYGGNKLLTGTVYLENNSTLSISQNTTDSTVTLNDDNTTLIQRSTTDTINGMGKSIAANSSIKHPVINGQIIENEDTTNLVKINKVSATEPMKVHNYLDDVGCIETSFTASKIGIVEYNSDPTQSVYQQTVNTTNKITFDKNRNLSEIYIKPKDDIPDTASIKIFSDIACSALIKEIKSPSEIKYDKTTEITINRFTPVEEFHPGNYSFMMLKKEDDVNKPEKRFALTAQRFENHAPSNQAGVNQTEYIIWSDKEASFGLPLDMFSYGATSEQKWRVENATENNENNIFKISEIAEYKPLKISKDDNDTTYGTSGGPQLMCGSYYWDESGKLVSDDSFTGNQTQLWKFKPAGLGLYILQTRPGTNPGYIYCNGDTPNNRCYLTQDISEASVFRIFNVTL